MMKMFSKEIDLATTIKHVSIYKRL